MTAVVLPRPEAPSRGYSEIVQLQNDPKVIEAVEAALKARREGRVQPWSRVKEEIGIR